MIERFARHPTASNLLMLLCIVAGLYMMPQLQRETLPDFAASEIEIRIPFPGATAEEVEEVVCQRVEDALDRVKFIKELRAEARESLAIVTVEMEKGGDVSVLQGEISTEIEAINDFPEDVEDAVIRQLGTTEVVMLLLASGPMSPGDLKIYCEELKDRIQNLKNVSLVTLEGFSDRQFRVELSREKLRRHGLTVQKVADILARQSVNLPVGVIETDSDDLLLRFVEERQSAAELEQVVLTGVAGGAEIQVRDVGQVVDTFEQPEEKSLLGRQRCGVLRIEKTKNQDTIRVARKVREFIEQERERHPNIQLAITQDASILVEERLNLLVKNGWQGIILVFFTLWLFFNVRLSFWVVMSLPVSFMAAFFVLPLMGQTINMMTMIAFLLALGLLMDDGIVIAENVARHLSLGKSSLRASVDGVREVAAGVLSSFLTTICVLGPLGSLSGFIGRVLQVIPLVLILVIAISLIEAFFILPAHLSHALNHVDVNSPNKMRRKFDDMIDSVQDWIARLVRFVVSWRYVSVGCVIGIFLCSIGMVSSGVVGFQGFPELEGDVVVGRILLPQGTPLAKTERVVEQVTTALERINQQHAREHENQKELVETVTVQFSKNSDAFESGPHVATISVDLLTSKDRNLTVDEVVSAWRNNLGDVPDVLSLTFGEPVFGPAGRPIEVRFQGTDLAELKSAAQSALQWFNSYEGVFNLTDDLRPGKQEFRIRLRDGAVGLGLDAAAMAGQLQAAFRGATADEIQVGPEQYEIDVQFRAADQDSISDLDDFFFLSPEGQAIPLSAVATIEQSQGWSRVARIDGHRTVTLIGDIDTRKANTAQLMRLFHSQKLPELVADYKGVRVHTAGETEESADTQTSMLRAAIIGLVGVFILLSFQFESWVEPLIVMVAIPLALIGVIWGHLLLGINLSMPSMLGFASLSGVVVNDSILLVLFLKKSRHEGSTATESASQASRLRFRAILLTSVTTIAGLLPLLSETSLQAQLLIPLAVSITFGLMASTLLVLFVIPCLYVILDDFSPMAAHSVDD